MTDTESYFEDDDPDANADQTNMRFISERTEQNPLDGNTFRKKFEARNAGAAFHNLGQVSRKDGVEPDSESIVDRITEENEKISRNYSGTLKTSDIESRMQTNHMTGTPEQPDLFEKRPKIKISQFEKALRKNRNNK